MSWSHPRPGHATMFNFYCSSQISEIFACPGLTETRTNNYVHQISGSQILKIWFANLFLDFGHADIGWAQYLHVLVSPETRTCKYFLARIPEKNKTSSLLKMNTEYQNYIPKYDVISWNPFQKIFACPSLR